jgi:hypothetical protein
MCNPVNIGDVFGPQKTNMNHLRNPGHDWYPWQPTQIHWRQVYGFLCTDHKHFQHN